MQCQQCDKQAMFHITELEAGEVRELHLCEDHARIYLNQAEADSQQEDSDTEGGPLGVGQTAKELSEIDQLVCDMCGITFFEFRNQGRLGCPHDYVQFENELEPLIANIHGEVEHRGRRPNRQKSVGGEVLPESTEELTRVIGMRKDIRNAVEGEDYERAGKLRDNIQKILHKWHAEDLKG
ncbi:MAG: UvrB/UvrC motif-containing protein [Planctomycetes bacterium]|nr:UvrB/UvrC motif-containing protein [Planctomycetota bacterium]MBL6909319.1 UvrB/UvrC motif-containing protein [Pirellulales bacterium]